MNYKFKKECKSILIPMSTKKFNLILSNNLPIKIKISWFFFSGLNTAHIYKLNIPFLNFTLYGEGDNVAFNNSGLQSNISYTINWGDYPCTVNDITDNWEPNTGYCIINIIFYYDN